MIDLNIKDYMARTTVNRLTLAETLDRMKSLLKSIAFETKIVTGEYEGFDDHARETRKELINYEFADLYYLQTCIDYGNYAEVNPYDDKVS